MLPRSCRLASVLIAGLFPALAAAQFISGSDGSDGALNITANTEIDLGLAAPGAWTDPSPVAGRGVYDADQWAVVFKFTTINVNSGVTVTFRNHSSGAPVVWLATGNVTINGSVNLNGATGHAYNAARTFSEPGPGGFAGSGAGTNTTNRRPSAGFGPGGAQAYTGGLGSGNAGYGTAGTGLAGVNGGTYGNPFIFPLIGGSGGGAGVHVQQGGGGAGGGAILIASSGNIALGGALNANGGAGGTNWGGGGSGGAIRLIANNVTGLGTLRALGGSPSYTGTSGKGRIRVEATTVSLTDGGDPNYVESSDVLGPVFPPSNKPTLKLTMVESATVPADPSSGIGTTDAIINDADSVTIQIEASNVPPGTTVSVRVVPERGDAFTVTSGPLVGDLTLSTATAVVPAFPAGRVELQARANWTP